MPIASFPLKRKLVLFVLVFTILLMVTGTAFADTTGPSITLSPANGSTVLYTTSWTYFYGSAWDADGVNVSSAVTTLDGVTLSNNWYNSYDEDSGEIYPNGGNWDYMKLNVSKGVHVLKVTMKDNLGNVTTAQSTFTVADDTSPPVISGLAPANGSTTSNTKPLIKATLSDPSGISSSSVIMKVDGIIVPHTLEYYKDVKYTPTTPLSYGVHTVYVYARDMKGYGGSTTWSFTVADTIPPTASGAIPANGSTEGTTKPVISVKLSDENGINAGTIALKVDGTPVSHSFDAATGIVSYTPAAPLSNGSHTVNVTAKDNYNNAVNHTWSFNIYIKPIILSTRTPGSGGWVKEKRPTISVKLSNDSIKQGTISMTMDGSPVQYSYDAATGLLSYTPAADLADGSHTVGVKVLDTNNVEDSASWKFNVDSTAAASAPIVLSSYPAGGDIVKPTIKKNWDGTDIESKTFSVAITVTDPDGLANNNYYLKVNGSIVGSWFEFTQGYSDDEGYWVLTGTNDARISTSSIPCEYGPNTIEVMVKDSLGNTTVKSWTFYMAGTNAVPEKNSILSNQQPNIQITVFGANLVKDNIKLYIDNESKAFDFISNSTHTGTINYTPAEPLANEKTHNVKVSVIDDNGTTDYTWYYYINTWGGSLNLAWDTIPMEKTCRSCHQAKTNLAEYKVDGTWWYKTLADFEKAIVDAGNRTGYRDDWVARTLEFNETHKLYKKGLYDPYDKYWIDNTTCEKCHTYADFFGTAHPKNYSNYYNNISGCTTSWCHGGNKIYLDYDPLTDHLPAVTKCIVCHGTPYQPKTTFNMSTDEDDRVSSSSKLGHDIGMQHLTSTDFSTCSSCHSKYLWREHERHTVNGAKLSCDTCHKSTNTVVQNAIANNQTGCSSCHASADHEVVHTSGLDGKCQICHKAALTQEHLNNTTTAGNNYSCNTCHASTGKEVKRTIAANSLYCAGCHTEGHNVIFADKVPADIPLYTGYLWSTPMEATIFVGEPSAPTGYDTGQVVISNRRADVTTDQIWTFYNNELTTSGWVLKSGTYITGNQFFTAEYQKLNRSVTFLCFNTEWRDGTGAVVNKGFRIEIWYK